MAFLKWLHARRIAGTVQERMQILAAISHDLQTPITRMRLRVDLADELPDADKFRADLEAMRTLVQEAGPDQASMPLRSVI